MKYLPDFINIKRSFLLLSTQVQPLETVVNLHVSLLQNIQLSQALIKIYQTLLLRTHFKYLFRVLLIL